MANEIHLSRTYTLAAQRIEITIAIISSVDQPRYLLLTLVGSLPLESDTVRPHLARLYGEFDDLEKARAAAEQLTAVHLEKRYKPRLRFKARAAVLATALREFVDDAPGMTILRLAIPSLAPKPWVRPPVLRDAIRIDTARPAFF